MTWRYSTAACPGWKRKPPSNISAVRPACCSAPNRAAKGEIFSSPMGCAISILPWNPMKIEQRDRPPEPDRAEERRTCLQSGSRRNRRGGGSALAGSQAQHVRVGDRRSGHDPGQSRRRKGIRGYDCRRMGGRRTIPTNSRRGWKCWATACWQPRRPISASGLRTKNCSAIASRRKDEAPPCVLLEIMTSVFETLSASRRWNNSFATSSRRSTEPGTKSSRRFTIC